MAKLVENKVNVVAELEVTSPEGKEIVRSFETAWRRSMTLPTPVHVMFKGFVRKD